MVKRFLYLARADGYYARFLAKKYGDIAALNKAYDTDYPDFASVRPIAESCHGEAELRHVRDQQKCYLENCFDYIETITAWLRAEGVNAPMCHNSGNPGMNALFVDLTKRMNEPFLLGSDHYYTLNQDWAQNNPTPQYAGQLIVNLIEDYGFIRSEMGYASAASVLLLLLIYFITKQTGKMFRED